MVCGDPHIARMYLKAGVDAIGDSRIQNIVKMRKNGIEGPYELIRIPMISEVPLAVENSDVILISEIRVLKEIAKRAAELKKRQKILYMVDIGDLREGVWYPEAVEEISKAVEIPSIELYGIGTNLGCYGGVIPDEERMRVLINVAKKLEEKGIKVNVVSGGNTAAVYLMQKGTLPQRINEYRIGEAIALGTDITNGKTFDFLRQDTFTLEAEVVEVKRKPSIPQGKIGKDSMGRTPHFEDKGIRLKAIVALGEQDIACDGLIPLDKGIDVLHASSDHTVLDVTECEKNISVGDKIRFRLKYNALLRAMTSSYVEKTWLKGPKKS